MLLLAADADVPSLVVRALRDAEPRLDIVRAQDAGRAAASDPEILAWAASERRVLLTRDHNTMIDFAYELVRADSPMCGVIEIPRGLALRRIIEDVLIIAIASSSEECANRIIHLPLR